MLMLVLVLTLIFPLVIKDQYIVRMGTLSLMYVGLAFSLNFVTGFLGQVSLGHAAFLGLGAYTSAILSARLGWPFLLTAFCGMIVAAFFGMLLGIPALMLRRQLPFNRDAGLLRDHTHRRVELGGADAAVPWALPAIARPNVFGIQIKSPASYFYLCFFFVLFIGTHYCQYHQLPYWPGHHVDPRGCDCQCRDGYQCLPVQGYDLHHQRRLCRPYGARSTRITCASLIQTHSILNSPSAS